MKPTHDQRQLNEHNENATTDPFHLNRNDSMQKIQIFFFVWTLTHIESFDVCNVLTVNAQCSYGTWMADWHLQYLFFCCCCCWDHWVLYKFWSSLVAHVRHTISRSPVSLIGIDGFMLFFLSYFFFFSFNRSIERCIYFK